MKLVGDKVASRHAAEGANIPLIPGMKEKSTSVDECMKAAGEIGSRCCSKPRPAAAARG